MLRNGKYIDVLNYHSFSLQLCLSQVSHDSTGNNRNNMGVQVALRSSCKDCNFLMIMCKH